MPTKVATIERFGGLDLRQDAAEWPGAVALTNIEFQPGRLKSRFGSSTFYAAGGPVYFMFSPESAAGSYVVIVGPTGIRMLSAAGAVLSTNSVSISSVPRYTSATEIGTPTGSYVYIQTAGVIRRLEGVTWTTPGTFPAMPYLLTKSPTDNRLIITVGDTAPVASGGHSHRVHFSDPGAPETFGANNYVDLEPGNGESLRAAAVFDGKTFLFKSSRFYVFYGTSTDSTGKPVFNYRAVVGEGVRPLHPGAAAVGSDGVYFVGRDGIYRTTGGPARLISAPISPFFTGQDQSAYWSGGTWAPTGETQVLRWHRGVLYATFSTTGGGKTLFTFDPSQDAWSRWGGAVLGDAFGVVASGDSQYLLVGSDPSVIRLDPSLSADSGAAILATYQSGYMDLGSAAKKTIRETILEGDGTISVAWASDYATHLAANLSAVPLGVAPAKATGRYLRAAQGRRFSYYLERSDTVGFELNSMAVNVIAERPAHVT